MECERLVRFGEAVRADREDRFVLSQTAREQIAEMYAELSDVSVGVMSPAHESELIEAL